PAPSPSARRRQPRLAPRRHRHYRRTEQSTLRRSLGGFLRDALQLRGVSRDVISLLLCLPPLAGLLHRQAATMTGSALAACASIRATCRLRRRATMTARAARVTIAPAPNAQWKPTTRL